MLRISIYWTHHNNSIYAFSACIRSRSMDEIEIDQRKSTRYTYIARAREWAEAKGSERKRKKAKESETKAKEE